MSEEKDKRPVLYNYFLNQSRKLLVEYEGTKDLESTKVKGDSREKIIIDFLEKILPERIYIHQGGEIRDSQNIRTEEIDIVLYRDDCLKMDYEGKKVFLVEGVFAAIEVKSKLDTKELMNSIESMKKVEDLTIDSRGVGISYGFHLERPLRILCSYESISHDKIITIINKHPTTLDLVFIMDSGALLTKNVCAGFVWQSETHTCWIPGKASALAFLYFYLASLSSSFIASPPSLQGYFDPIDGWYD